MALRFFAILITAAAALAASACGPATAQGDTDEDAAPTLSREARAVVGRWAFEPAYTRTHVVTLNRDASFVYRSTIGAPHTRTEVKRGTWRIVRGNIVLERWSEPKQTNFTLMELRPNGDQLIREGGAPGDSRDWVFVRR